MIPSKILQDGFVFSVCILMIGVGISLIVRLIHWGWCYCLFKDNVVIGYFGSRDEVISFFWSLCDVTKDTLSTPMYKSNSFLVAKSYLKSLGYDIKYCKPEGFKRG